MVGVTKLVHHLSKSKIPIAVASSSSTSSFRLKTERHSGLFSFFDVVVLGDDERVKNAKPAPDIFLTAADSLGESPVSTAPTDCEELQVSPTNTVSWWRTLPWGSLLGEQRECLS